MRNLVPIKVKIELTTDGYAKYPTFNSLTIVGTSGMDWSKYVDVQGLGWHYDKTSGHKEEATDSPVGMQWGVLIVPRVFADEAIAMFPTLCTKLTETELTDFYDNKAHAHELDETVNEQALSVYKAITDAGGTLTVEQTNRRTNALDVTHPEPGVTKNLNKKWADYKIKVGVNII